MRNRFRFSLRPLAPTRRLEVLAVLPWALALLAIAALPSLANAEYEVQNCNLVFTGEVGTQTQTACYFESNLRLDPTPLSRCRPGEERDGALCYPPCSAGYRGVGPVCWQTCPAGYTDDGAFCRRDAIIIGADNSACPWYDKCGLTFARGCSRCPAGYRNDGCTCRIDAHIFAKATYSRGLGTSLICAEGREQVGALCYGPCPSGSRSDGVYCTALEQTCEERQVQEPLPPLGPFCFKFEQGPTSSLPCFTEMTAADGIDNATELAQCRCTNCEVTPISCADLATACSR